MFFSFSSGAASGDFEAAGDHDADVRAVGEGNGVADVGFVAGRDKQRLPALGDRHHRGEVPVGGAIGGRNLRVGAGPGDQILDALHARVALLLEVLVLAIRISGRHRRQIRHCGRWAGTGS